MLTENGGVFGRELLGDYREVNVYRAIDVLYMLFKEGLIGTLLPMSRST